MEINYNQSNKKILTVLERKGIIPERIVIQSNLYEFPYKNLRIRFINDNPKRTSFGTIFKPQEDIDNLERIMTLKSLTFSSKQEGDEAQKLMDYKHFIFKGKLEQRINNVMVLADMPMQYVLRLQDDKRTIYLEDKNLYPISTIKKIIYSFKR